MSRFTASLAFIFLFCVLVSGCAFRSYGLYKQKGTAHYKVWGETENTMYRGVFEICRARHAQGYKMLRTPKIDPNKGLPYSGDFACDGGIDDALATRYDRTPVKFTEGRSYDAGKREFFLAAERK